jgi:hypothetical protein
VRDEDVSGLGEAESPTSAFDEPDASVTLERGQLLRHGGTAHVQRLPGRRDRSVRRQREAQCMGSYRARAALLLTVVLWASAFPAIQVSVAGPAGPG